jgi:hypothetical protein
MRWAFFCLLRPRGVRVPVPWRLVRTPRVSGLVAAAPKNAIYTTTHICSSFRPPSNNVIPLASPTMKTRLLHADKELSHRQGRPCVHVLNKSTRAKSRGGYLCGKVCVSIYPATPFLPVPLRQTQTPFQSSYATPNLPRSTTPCGLRAIAVTGSCPGPR